MRQELLPEHDRVAVVGAARGQQAIDDQPPPSRTRAWSPKPAARQAQHVVARRLEPRRRVCGPRPTDDRRVVTDLGRARRGLAAVGQAPGRRALDGAVQMRRWSRSRVDDAAPGQQRQGGRPARLVLGSPRRRPSRRSAASSASHAGGRSAASESPCAASAMADHAAASAHRIARGAIASTSDARRRAVRDVGRPHSADLDGLRATRDAATMHQHNTTVAATVAETLHFACTGRLNMRRIAGLRATAGRLCSRDLTKLLRSRRLSFDSWKKLT